MDPETDPDMDPEKDPEPDLDLDPETDWELELDSWQSALRIAKSAVLWPLPPDCYSSIINCGTVRPLAFCSQIFTSGFSNPQYGHLHCG
jgi:hypothetical protein